MVVCFFFSRCETVAKSTRSVQVETKAPKALAGPFSREREFDAAAGGEGGVGGGGEGLSAKQQARRKQTLPLKGRRVCERGRVRKP